jgi:hypothetical protein
MKRIPRWQVRENVDRPGLTGCAGCDLFTVFARFDHWQKARHTGLGIGFSDEIHKKETYCRFPFLKYAVATTLT